MKLIDLKNRIIQNNIPNILIFKDNEHYLCKQYINYISNSINKPIKYFNNFIEAILCMSLGLVDPLYVISVDSISSDQLSILLNSNNNVICIVNDFFDKASELYSEFNKVDKLTILAYINNILKNNKITINQDKLLEFIDYCNCDLGICMNELDKIICLNQATSNVVLDYMLNNGFPDYRNINVFKSIDKIIHNNYEGFYELNNSNESIVTIMFNIYNKARNLFIDNTKLNKNQDYLCKVLKASNTVYNSIIDGTIAPEFALKYFISEVLDG